MPNPSDSFNPRRRRVIGQALATMSVASTGALLGCGGSEAEDDASATSQPASVSGAPDSMATAQQNGVKPIPSTGTTVKYRYQQTRLFQATPVAFYPSRVAGGDDFPMDRFGPTADFVAPFAGWAWDRRGGDWVDALGTRHGAAPWASVVTNKVSGSTARATYTLDVTELLRKVLLDNRWLAVLLRSVAPRVISGSKGQVPPRIDVRYADGTSATLRCLVSGSTTGTTYYPSTLGAELQLPLMAEFDRPTKGIASATLVFEVTQHWSGNPLLTVMLLDPPVNRDPVRHGLAAAANLDAGLPSHPAVIGVHRMLDGTTLHDFVANAQAIRRGNYNALAAYDPAMYGTGPADHALFPHAELGKFVGINDATLVASNYLREGFRPVAPGVGALRIFRGAEVSQDGAIVGYAVNQPADAKIFMPPEHFGVLDEIYLRYYFRIGTASGGPLVNSINTRYQVRNSAGGKVIWTDCAGKTGITPAHDTSEGGVSGSSGGPAGWQMRQGWAENDLADGPDVGGWTVGPHLYDFQYNNPAGHRYGLGQGLAVNERSYGQRGGLGGLMYAHQWYCLEMRLKLNSVDTPAPDGTGMWKADGQLDYWVDGRLAYSKSGMVMRSLPLRVSHNADPSLYLPPTRRLGIRDLWLNWFHGGLTKSSRDRVIFVSAPVWARQYIGPMSGASPATSSGA